MPLPLLLLLRNVSAYFRSLHFRQNRLTVVSLIRYYLFDAAQVDLRLFLGSSLRFMRDQFCYCFASLSQCFLYRRRIAQVSFLQRHRHYCTGLHIDRVFCLMGQMGPPIFHPGDARIPIDSPTFGCTLSSFACGLIWLNLRGWGSRSRTPVPDPAGTLHSFPRCLGAQSSAGRRWLPTSWRQCRPACLSANPLPLIISAPT